MMKNAFPNPSADDDIRSAADSARVGRQGLPSQMPESTYDLLDQAAHQYGDRIAVSFFLDVASHRRTTDWTYRDLFRRVTKTANLFETLGIRSGDVVAVMLPNLPEMHMLLWGGEAAGIVMPLNPLLEAAALSALLTAANAKVLVTLAPFPGTDLYEKGVQIVASTPSLQHVVLVDLARHVPGVRRLGAAFVARRAKRRASPMPARVRVHRLEGALRRMPGHRLNSGRTIRSTDLSSYFCTGGTTGLPKIAMRTHGQEVANAWMTRRMLGSAVEPDAAVFCGLPLFHVNAVIAMGLASFLSGAKVVIGTPQGFRAPGLLKALWGILAYHRISAFNAVPTLLAGLLENPPVGEDLSHLKYVFSGAAPLSADLLHRFEEICGVKVSEGYGLTEGACTSAMSPVAVPHRAGSVGLPLPWQELRTVIVDSDGAFVRDAETDEIGAIVISGPNVFNGYLSDEHNRGLWLDRGDDRPWLNTGDLGRLDADGYLWITGRLKDLIIRGGHNIDPSIIEDALLSHPDVSAAAAIGRPDAYAGEVPVAYVQPRTGSTVTAEDLIAHVGSMIGERAAIPKAVILMEALPTTPVGKIFKPQLRLAELAYVTKQTLGDAAIPFTAVEAVSDERRGSVVRVATSVSDRVAASEALGAFAFAHELI